MSRERRYRLALNEGSWREVARRHTEDSRILAREKRFIGAIYLKGYAIECTLKAMLLANHDIMQMAGKHESKLRERLKKKYFSGAKSHELLLLLDGLLIGDEGRNVRLRSSISRFADTWKVALRYSNPRICPTEARDVLGLADDILVELRA